jgi:hypothetical protein
VADGRWVGPHRPVGGGLLLRQSSGPLECQSGVAEGPGPSGDNADLWITSLAGLRNVVLAEVVQACGSPA